MSEDKNPYRGPLEKVNENLYRIPQSFKSGMRVDGYIYMNDSLRDSVVSDNAPMQVANVAYLPGIQKGSYAMPDIHWGYGFPIGGVAAMDPNEGGVISPGGVGYDINCGVRLLRTNLHRDDLPTDEEHRQKLGELISLLYKKVPSGVGKSGPYRFDGNDMRGLLSKGVRFLLKNGLATESDLDHCESNGSLEDADPDAVSKEAQKRGFDQCGTLGSGNHFLEIQVVDEVLDPKAAQIMGIEKDAICVMIHSGSRGLGYQICEDAIRNMRKIPEKRGYNLPDKQLVCAPFHDSYGKQYFTAMNAAANYAWANRQLITWQVREIFEEFFGQPWESLGLQLVYDVAHNIAKLEQHEVDERMKTVLVHRKGATRAFPPGHREVPEKYRAIGQPVLIPGDMGRASWLLLGREESMERSFGSCAHGAGRLMSRGAAIRSSKGRNIQNELADSGVLARCRNWKGLAEEKPEAYKDVDVVVDIIDQAQIAKKVARMRPIAVVKG